MDERQRRGWVEFMLRAHLWKHHSVGYEWTSGLSLAALGELHRWYNCPPGEARRYLGCRFRTRRRRSPRLRVSPDA